MTLDSVNTTVCGLDYLCVLLQHLLTPPPCKVLRLCARTSEVDSLNIPKLVDKYPLTSVASWRV